MSPIANRRSHGRRRTAIIIYEFMAAVTAKPPFSEDDVLKELVHDIHEIYFVEATKTAVD